MQPKNQSGVTGAVLGELCVSRSHLVLLFSMGSRSVIQVIFARLIFLTTSPSWWSFEEEPMKHNDVQRRFFLQALGACLVSTRTAVSFNLINVHPEKFT